MTVKWLYPILGILGYLNSQITLPKTQHDPEHSLDKLYEAMKKAAPAVVLVRTFSDKAPKENKIYNSALRPRFRPHHYDMGVITGVCVTPGGIVIVPLSAIENSSKIVVSFNTEYRPYSQDTTFTMTENDYQAKILHTDPKQNIAYLKIHSKKKFPYLVIAKPTRIVSTTGHRGIATMGIIGKAKADRFLTVRHPYTTTNNFQVYYSHIMAFHPTAITGQKVNNPKHIHGENSPNHETAGGAVITDQGKLFAVHSITITPSSKIKTKR